MIKITSNNDFNFDIESVSLITDSKQLTKRASAKSLLKYEKTAGQTDLHIIALGAYEGTGFNRNGDAFMEKCCKANHHYFKDSDRAVHRHHKNKPESPKYGNIKAAAYNDPMKRIELIVGLDNEKCADILHEQETTGNTNWSMASKQAHDVCSWCGHKAKTDKDRCEHIPRNVGELNKKGEMCGMLNPDPRWFEISYVHRPADRIGMSLGKMASAAMRPMLPSDFLNIYGDIYVPAQLEFGISKKASDKRELLKKLAEMEKHIDAMTQGGGAHSSRDQYLSSHGAAIAHSAKLSPKVIDELRKYEPSKLLKVLADNGIVFSPEDFNSYLFGDRANPQHAQGMKSHLPDMHQQLHGSNDHEVANNERFEPSHSDSVPPSLRDTGKKLAPHHSMNPDDSVQRVMAALMQHGGGQQAPQMQQPMPPEHRSKHAADKELARQYTAYKLAALNYLKENNKLDEDLMWNCLIQNRI